jgi:four helix bundle protein
LHYKQQTQTERQRLSLSKFNVYTTAVEFYRTTRTLGVPYHLRNQLDRAASSIVLNIAEGAGRRTFAEKRRFYDIALGSARECYAIIDLCPRASEKHRKDIDAVCAMLTRLCYPKTDTQKSPR